MYLHVYIHTYIYIYICTYIYMYIHVSSGVDYNKADAEWGGLIKQQTQSEEQLQAVRNLKSQFLNYSLLEIQ